MDKDISRQKGERIYVNVEKIGNSHNFDDKFVIFQGFSEHKNVFDKVIFNVFVTPVDERFSVISLMVRVYDDNINDILTSMDSDPRVSISPK